MAISDMSDVHVCATVSKSHVMAASAAVACCPHPPDDIVETHALADSLQEMKRRSHPGRPKYLSRSRTALSWLDDGE